MKLEREQMWLPTYRGVDTNPPFRWNHIDTSGRSSFDRFLDQARIQEVRFNIHQEENRERREKNSQRQKTDGLEPFVDPNDPLKPPQKKERDLFVNFYGGNYAQNMQLNRKGVEKALRIAHLDGQVFLSSLSPNRQRSIEANPDGSVAGKGSLMLGEKVEEEEKDNPLYKVVPISQGWRIEVNDQKLTEELTEKEKLSGKELQIAFVKRFNGVLREGLFECVWREKLSSVKDKSYRTRLFLSIVYGFIVSSGLIYSHNAFDFAYAIGAISILYATVNTVGRFLTRLDYYDRTIRNIDHPLELFMPFVEVDKVARAFAYFQVKGRRLMRETREEK